MAGWPTGQDYAQTPHKGRSRFSPRRWGMYTLNIMEPPSLASLFLDLATIAGLIVLASFFVAAEIALISLRDSQVREIATRGRRGARVAALAAHPNRLLAAVQIGVTVSGFLSAALGADQLGDYVIPWLESLGIANAWATTISLIGVTLVIAYFSLVFGELVPKRVALFRA